MAIRLDDLAKERKSITFEFGDESVTATYRLNALTPMQGDLIARMGAMFKANGVTLNEENRLNDDVIEVLSWLVTEWDVIGDNGKPLPITKKWLQRLPTNFLYTLFGEILADMRPNAQSAAMPSDS